MRAADALLLLAAAGGILGLAMLAELMDPPRIPLSELRLHEGEAVAVEARVLRAWPAGTGAQVLSLADGTGEVTAFWREAGPLEGAKVRVEGAAEREGGRWSLRLRTLKVLAPAAEPLGAEEAARLAPLLRDREVAVAGRLDWPAEGEPVLVDGPSRLALRAQDPHALARVAGEHVVARGALRFDGDSASYGLDAWEVRGA
jgi:hypothetical protein